MSASSNFAKALKDERLHTGGLSIPTRYSSFYTLLGRSTSKPGRYRKCHQGILQDLSAASQDHPHVQKSIECMFKLPKGLSSWWLTTDVQRDVPEPIIKEEMVSARISTELFVKGEC
ncbi:unnamed protein product [Strongylus vulgaris]|uniref:Uncharacterized protein n=1 Tax=Strongylus vulgaris TaxID=40348 RepID=A0A3P7JZV3_STRVU|nr:unnamed protein product [Strongylus vulgaris]